MKLLVVLFYIGMLLLIGAVASRRMRDLRDYFAAGKRLGFLSAAFSARATGESAWLLLGLTGMGAAVGARAFWVAVGEVAGVAAAWLLMARRFNRLTRRYDAITVPDYLEARFRDGRHLLRLASAAALLVFVTIYVSAQIDATGTAFRQFLGWNYYAGAVVGFLVVLIYIVSGGFLAVVWSDVFQGALMLLGLVVLPIVGLAYAGGIAPVLDGLAQQDPGLLSLWGPGGPTPLAFFSILSFLAIGLGFLGSPQVFVRYLALRSEREVGPGALVAILWTTLADIGAVATGMVGRYLLVGPSQTVEGTLGNAGQNALPLLAEALLPTLLVGVTVAIVLSAIMSTVDSLLVLASSAFVRDYYQKVRHPDLADSTLIRRSRVTTAVLALIALGIAMTVAALSPTHTIFWFVIFGWSGIAATFCPTIILSLFWRRMTARGALAAMSTGFLCIPLFKFVMPLLPVVGPAFGALEEMAPAFLLGGFAGIVVSLTDAGGAKRLAGVEEELQFGAGTPATATRGHVGLPS